MAGDDAVDEDIPADQRLLQGRFAEQGLHSLRSVGPLTHLLGRPVGSELPKSVKTAPGQSVPLDLLAPSSALGCIADKRCDAEPVVS